MADIRAFRGWRYNLARVGELSAVIAPPYDIVVAELHEVLLSRHPANIIRVELSKEFPTDTEESNRYTRAARQLHDWKYDGIMLAESHPAIYVVHQQFQVEGRTYTRHGFLARLKLEPFSEGNVFAHEETMAGPKADRLRLYHATGMNISPVFGMFPDAANEVQDQLDRAIRGRTPLEAADHLGVVSRMWPLTDELLISQIRAHMGPRPIFIADGHHRYETAVRYRDDRRAVGAVRDDDSPANFCLMMCVGMSDPGLIILPTHRLVSGLSRLRSAELRSLIEPEFEIEEMGSGASACRETWETIEVDGGQNLLGLGTVDDGNWLLVRLRGTAAMDGLVPEHSLAWRGLGVSILHELVLSELLRSRLAGKPPQLRYIHLIDEVLECFGTRQCDLACLVPAATMNHVQQIASTGERMPAKSTYFYPKLLTGLVLNPIA